MQVVSPGNTIAEQWKTYAADVREAIEQGFLDDEIRTIARACFDRRDRINDGAVPNPADVPPKFYEQVVRDDAPPAKKPGRKPGAKPLRRRGAPSSTFTYEGMVYNRADIIGKTFPSTNGTLLVVRGIGARAVKVEFVHSDGHSLITSPLQVPQQYREKKADGSWGIKDPIFMDRSVVRDLVRMQLTPVARVAERDVE